MRVLFCQMLDVEKRLCCWMTSSVAIVSSCEMLFSIEKILCRGINFCVESNSVLRDFRVVRCGWMLIKFCIGD